jgi:S1/P1 Nuclease
MPRRTLRRLWFVAAIAVLCVVGTATPAWAWGRLGHRVISRLAEARLTPTAKAAIAELLGPGESLADASLWADENHGRLPMTAPWHYIGIPLDERATTRSSPQTSHRRAASSTRSTSSSWSSNTRASQSRIAGLPCGF